MIPEHSSVNSEEMNVNKRPREDETDMLPGRKTRPPGKLSEGRKRSTIFQECMTRLFSINFKKIQVARKLVEVEITVLKRFCVDHRVPLLSSSQAHGLVGKAPKKLDEGSLFKTYLNTEEDFVMKYALNLFSFLTLIVEAKVM